MLQHTKNMQFHPYLERKPSEPATFVQQLPNMFQTSMTFGIRWVVVVLTSLIDYPTCSNVHGVWDTLGSRCTNVAGSLGKIKLLHLDGQTKYNSYSSHKYADLLVQKFSYVKDKLEELPQNF